MERQLPYAVLFLRLALAVTLLAAIADKLGYWGEPGTPNVLWGDWDKYEDYLQALLFFLPQGLTEKLSIFTTLLEAALALMLLVGLKVRWAATGTGIYTLLAAILLITSFGLKVPLNYSLFVISATSFLLACCPIYRFTLHGVKKRSTNHLYY